MSLVALFRILMAAVCPITATTCIPTSSGNNGLEANLVIAFGIAIAVGVGLALYVRKRLAPSRSLGGAQKGAG